jgi:hypothetical protein
MMRLKLLLAAAILLSATAVPSSAQYMYLDANGDGVNTADDRLSAEGPTILTIYLNTNHDKDGSLQTCNSHTQACGAITTSQPLDMFGYTLALKAVGGTVTWGTFTASDAAYTNSSPQISDSTEIEINQFRPTSTFTTPGLVAVGTLPVTIVSGSPAIQWQVGPGVLNPFGFGTGFATLCDGSTQTNYYVLGDPANPCGSGGDWFDTDGTRATVDSAPAVEAPSALVTLPEHSMTITVGAADPNGEPITSLVADLSRLPFGNDARFTTSADNRMGSLVWTPSTADTGTYPITFTASNVLSGSATTMGTVASSTTVRSVRIQLPGAGYRADTYYYSTLCLGLCGQETVVSGDSGQIYVPVLMSLGNGQYTPYDRIHVDFPAANSVAYFKQDQSGPYDPLAPSVEWYPSVSLPDPNYTVTGIDAWKDWTLHETGRVHDFYARMYGFAPQSVRFHYGAAGISADLSAGILWKPSRAEVEEGEGGDASESAEWVLAHEYAHILGATVEGENMACCQTNNCIHPSGCAEPFICPEGPWTEGFADGMADFYVTQIYPLHPEWIFGFNCGFSTPGTEVENNVCQFVLFMSQRGPKDFMDTFRYATFFAADPSVVFHAHNAGQYYDLWHDTNPGAYTIRDHHPGPWHMDAIWAKAIALDLTGVGLSEESETDSFVFLDRMPTSSNLVTRVSLKIGRAGAIEIFNVSGRLVRRFPWAAGVSKVRLIQLDVRSLPGGVYMARARDEGGRQVGAVRKLVVLR